MYKYLAACLLVPAMFLAPSLAVAQPATKLDKMEKSLSDLDGMVSEIETGKTVSTHHNVNAAMEKYATDAFEAFKEARAALEADSRAEKDAGGLAKMKAFEDKAAAHKEKVDKIAARVETISAGVRKGDIKIEPGEFNRFTPAQKKELKKWLAPGAAQHYKFSTVTSDGSASEAFADRQEPDASRCEAIVAENWSRPGTLENLLGASHELAVPRADAALGIGCYGICVGSLGWGCLSCIVSAGGAGLQAYNSYVSWKNSCGSCRWYRPWGCACRAAALAWFLGTLA
jgi:hypothetical protein